MSATRNASSTTQAAIFARLWELEDGMLPRSIARAVLKLGFRDEDKARIHELAAKNQDGTISRAELAELDNYIEAGDLMALLQSKARRTLDRSKGVSS